MHVPVSMFLIVDDERDQGTARGGAGAALPAWSSPSPHFGWSSRVCIHGIRPRLFGAHPRLIGDGSYREEKRHPRDA